mmetsp:Transcript_50074/g.143984  ORF Transcript_50074/g.143984 Transcript_50074/m.143984 type:complete len:271 (+) Transcript_50074:463-1275(+)
MGRAVAGSVAPPVVRVKRVPVGLHDVDLWAAEATDGVCIAVVVVAARDVRFLMQGRHVEGGVAAAARGREVHTVAQGLPDELHRGVGVVVVHSVLASVRKVGAAPHVRHDPGRVADLNFRCGHARHIEDGIHQLDWPVTLDLDGTRARARFGCDPGLRSRARGQRPAGHAHVGLQLLDPEVPSGARHAPSHIDAPSQPAVGVVLVVVVDDTLALWLLFTSALALADLHDTYHVLAVDRLPAVPMPAIISWQRDIAQADVAHDELLEVAQR